MLIFQVFEAIINFFAVIFSLAQTNWEARYGDLVVSTLVSRSSDPGSSPGQEHALRCSFGAKHFTFTVPLSTQVYKWVPLKLMLKVTWDVLASHPGRS